MRITDKLFLESFLTAYLDAALWASTDDKGNPLDRTKKVSDIDPETIAAMERDSLKFYTDNNIEGMNDSEQKRAGHDFWLTRNRHGAGFWDGDWDEPQATLLSNAAHEFGEFDLYVGDDGKVYGTPLTVPDNDMRLAMALI